MSKRPSGLSASERKASSGTAVPDTSFDLRQEVARLEAELRERDERLHLAEVSAGIGIWDIDVGSDTVRGAAQFFRIMGVALTDAAVPMDLLRALRFPEDRERVNQGYVNAVK